MKTEELKFKMTEFVAYYCNKSANLGIFHVIPTSYRWISVHVKNEKSCRKILVDNIHPIYEYLTDWLNCPKITLTPLRKDWLRRQVFTISNASYHRGRLCCVK